MNDNECESLQVLDIFLEQPVFQSGPKLTSFRFKVGGVNILGKVKGRTWPLQFEAGGKMDPFEEYRYIYIPLVDSYSMCH